MCTMGWNKERLDHLKGLKLTNVRGIFEEEMYCLYYISWFVSISYTYVLKYRLNYCPASNTADRKDII